MRTTIRLRSPALALLFAAGCAAPEAVAPPPPAAPPIAKAAVTAPPPVVTAPAVAPAPPPAPPEPPMLAATFHRELPAAITALVIERAPLLSAATRDSVWMHEKQGWHEEKLPADARGVPMAIFYGRDDRIRAVSVQPGKEAVPGIYLRFKNGRFFAALGEIGKLGKMPRPLVSVLGNDDPEIVCQPAVTTCVVKRRTGWTWIEGPADIAQVTIGEGTGWGVAGQQLLRVGAKDRWEKVGAKGTWAAADMLFGVRDHAWIVETAAARIHVFDGAGWKVVDSPIEKPHAIWGAKKDALWLAGDGGLAFFDGAVWRRVKDAPAPLAVVGGRASGEVWVGGAGGLFRVDVAR